jgi:DNA repair protein RecN (Recombination protein N)
MLTRLTVSDYAIVRHLEINFTEGLTVLSGETGAGKSILVGAIGLILGERASTENVRSGESLAVVEAEVRYIPDFAKRELDSLGISVDGDTIVIRREVQARASSRAFINDQLISISSLKSVTSSMFDLVGQHQQQYLIDVAHHVTFLDSFAGLQNNVSTVERLYSRWSALSEELASLKSGAERNHEMSELYRFQVQEIDQAALSVCEEEELIAEKRVLENAERLRNLLCTIAGAVAIDDSAITSQIAHVESLLADAAEIDNHLRKLYESVRESRYVLEDVGRSMASRAESVQADPIRLQEIESRLDIYYDLKKKYGGSVEAVDAYRAKAGEELASDDDISDRIKKTQSELAATERDLAAAAADLSRQREVNSTKLAKRIEKELGQLGIIRGQIEVRVARRQDDQGLVELDGERYRVHQDGIDDVEFYFSANRGEGLRPLAKIASGGELSRVMLALKTVGATQMNLETLVFDEVDSGIGGEVATAVGRKLRDLARKHQVLVITHLQQIAAAGDQHYRVFKQKSDGRMITRIKRLSGSERREEIGRMLSGDRLTETSLKQAEELLSEFE